MKQNLLIIGPIGDIGGRELETGFITNTLNDDYNVNICSTANYSSKSQIFDFVSEAQITSLNQMIFNENLWFKSLACISYLKSKKNGFVLDYVSNSLAKETGYRNYALKQIKKKIDKADAIIICAQISSNYIEDIVVYSNAKQKPILFRTSSKIKDSDVNCKYWLNKVTLFAHHSLSNADRLSFFHTNNYHLIDQCTFKEAEMLKIPPTDKFKSLLYIGRLSSEKGIRELVQFFKNSKMDIILKIIGDGPLYNELKSQCGSLKSIELLGFLNQDEILQHIKYADAIIIPSHEESGPLVGLEAMASARLVISTKVGAMLDRLNGCQNQFWFDINNLETLKYTINHIEKLDASKIEETAIENRNRYINKYRKEVIQNQYKKAIFKLLKK